MSRIESQSFGIALHASAAATAGDRVPALFNKLMLVAAALVVPALVLQGSSQPDVRGVATALDWLIWVTFVVELGVRVRAAPDRGQWLKRHPWDLALVVATPPFAPAAVQGARAFRLLRLVRLVRVAHLSGRLLSAGGLRQAGAVTAFMILAGGTAFADVERHRHHAVSVWDGIWWAITTVTTVGYGDISPHTDAGRVIAIGLMVCGIGFVAMLTAAFAQRFVRQNAPIDEVLTELRAISDRLDRLERRTAAAGHARDDGALARRPGAG